MSFKLRYFTVAEADSLIPRIIEILEKAQETKVLIEQKINDWRKQHPNISVADEAVIRGQVEFLASRLEVQLGEIADLGCIPKDLDMGLVDFSTRIDGQEGYLCWKLGESNVQYWHTLTEGVAGRKPLSHVKKIG